MVEYLKKLAPEKVKDARVWIGDYVWRVLSIDESEVLLIAENVLGLHAFDDSVKGWVRDKLRTGVPDTDWEKFCDCLDWLTAEEAENLFSSDRDRVATNIEGTELWWWASTLSLWDKFRAIYVDGEVTRSGHYYTAQYGGVRPILRIPITTVS